MENETFETALHDVANSPDLDASTGDVDSMDADFDNLAAAFLQDEFGLQENPAEEAEELPESEEEAQESSDDDAPVEEDEDDQETDDELPEEEEEVEEAPEDDEVDDEDLPVFDYDDVVKGKLPVKIGGDIQHLTIGQIQAEIGRARAASKEQNEVKAAREELESYKQQLEEREAAFDNREKVDEGSAQLAMRAERIKGLEQQLADARNSQDMNKMVWLRDAIDQETSLFRQQEADVQEAKDRAYQDNLRAQQKILNDRGYGNILADNQRMDLLRSYATEVLSPGAQKLVSDDATLFMALEKARLYDKGQSQVKKGKLTPSKAPKKTLKAAKGKVNPTPKKADVDPFQAFANKSFGLE